MNTFFAHTQISSVSASTLKRVLMRAIVLITLIICVSGLAKPSAAQDMKFSFPAACVLHENCWVSSYFDLNRRNGRTADFTCGTIAKDNQNGVHVSLKDWRSMTLGVPVIAAQDGVIASIYEGLPDLVIDPKRMNEYSDNPCGNAVLIEHEDGWYSRYCHLRKGSIRVKSGDAVVKGQPIAQIGSSGMTDWPRLDFSLSRNGYLFDPFSGKTSLEKCGGIFTPLWEQPMTYTPFAVMQSGFYVGEPKKNVAEGGNLPNYNVLPSFTPDISLWAVLMNLRKGDRIVMQILDPKGFVLRSIDEELDFDADRYLVYLRAVRPRNLGWDLGLHTGTVQLVRQEHAETYEVFRTNTLNIYEAEKPE